MTLLRRDFKPGDVLLVHLSDQTSVQGTFVAQGRTFLRLAKHKIEAGPQLVESTAECVLVPRRLVKLIEVVGR